MNNSQNQHQRSRPIGIYVRQYGPALDPRRNYERYLVLARKAAAAGDAVEAEHWYQHAEHYFRMMKEGTA